MYLTPRLIRNAATQKVLGGSSNTPRPKATSMKRGSSGLNRDQTREKHTTEYLAQSQFLVPEEQRKSPPRACGREKTAGSFIGEGGGELVLKLKLALFYIDIE